MNLLSSASLLISSGENSYPFPSSAIFQATSYNFFRQLCRFRTLPCWRNSFSKSRSRSNISAISVLDVASVAMASWGKAKSEGVKTADCEWGFTIQCMKGQGRLNRFCPLYFVSKTIHLFFRYHYYYRMIYVTGMKYPLYDFN